jgi:SAM-dependent methyltransferase
MNSSIGKEILSLVREGDYAHPGEEQAIDLVFAGTTRDPARPVLDVECGRGGTADYVRRHGWGTVTGVDIDGETLILAAEHYPEVRFVKEDVVRIGARWQAVFELIYLFNSLYVFPDQQEALRRIRQTAKKDATLVIFEYTDVSGAFREWANEDQSFWTPINLRSFPDALGDTGWELDSTVDVSDRYLLWYRQLIARIQAKKNGIVGGFGLEWYDYAYAAYAALLILIEKKVVGGAIIRARSR